MDNAKRIEEILEEAADGNVKMSMSISCEDKINGHMTLNAEDIEIVNGYLLQISTDYTECTVNLNDANINTYEELGSDMIDITFDNLVISLGTF